MQEAMREVVVLGGGISGLTAAWSLKKAGIAVCLLEANAEVGGCTRSERRDGFLLEKGPFNVIVRDPSFEQLLEDVADTIIVVTADRTARARYVYRRGCLHRVPSNPAALLTTPLLSLAGRLRLLRGLLWSGKGGELEQTIEQAATRRFGRETSDTLVSAVIAGIFSGDIRKLSLRACFPTAARIDREAGSLLGYGLKSALGAMTKRNQRRRRRWRGLVSINGGLGQLTGELGRRLGRDLSCRAEVQSVAAIDGGYEVNYRNADGSLESVRARRLVSALSAPRAAGLLGNLVPNAASILDSIESASLVVLNLGFRRADVSHPLKGYGFLVPHHEDLPLLGVLWADSIFPHHAPAGHCLMRVFVGGTRQPDAHERPDDELVASVLRPLRRLLGITGSTCLVDVCRYREAIPQYHPGHRDRIQRLRAAAAKQPGLHLVGNYMEGLSLNDCVRLATRVAGEVVAEVEMDRNKPVTTPAPPPATPASAAETADVAARVPHPVRAATGWGTDELPDRLSSSEPPAPPRRIRPHPFCHDLPFPPAAVLWTR